MHEAAGKRWYVVQTRPRSEALACTSRKQFRIRNSSPTFSFAWDDVSEANAMGSAGVVFARPECVHARAGRATAFAH